VTRIRGTVLLESGQVPRDRDRSAGAGADVHGAGVAGGGAAVRGDMCGGRDIHAAAAGDRGRRPEVVVEVLVPGRLRGVLTAPVIEGVDVQLPTLALGPASRLEGSVLDRRGQPVAGALVAALPVPSLGEPEPWRVTSGVDGGFVLDTIPRGRCGCGRPTRATR
jgi:hypothetical protein